MLLKLGVEHESFYHHSLHRQQAKYAKIKKVIMFKREQKTNISINPYSWALTNLCATDGVLTQVDPWRLAILQAACWDIWKQILQTFVFAVDLHSWDTYRKACASFLPALADELEEPGDGTGRNAKALRRAVFANHGVRLACWGGESKLLILAAYWQSLCILVYA